VIGFFACSVADRFLPVFFSLTEVEKDISALRVGFKSLRAELEVQQARAVAGQTDPDDRFVPVMTDFVTVATFGFTELEELLAEAKERVRPSFVTCEWLQLTWAGW